MRNTPLATIPVPDSTDVADVPTHLYNAMTAMEKRLNLVFASSAARDAAFTAAGVTPTDGLKCYLSDTDTQQTYLNGTWTSQEPTIICTSGTRPSSPTHVGMRIYETDTKATRVWDGTYWRAEGVRALGTSGAWYGSSPSIDTSQMLFQAGVATGTVQSVIGIPFVAVTFPTAFPNGVVSVVATPAYSPNYPNAGFWVQSPSLSGFTFSMMGNLVTVGGATSLTWMAWGW